MVVYKTCIMTNLGVKLSPVILDLSLLGLVFLDAYEWGLKGLSLTRIRLRRLEKNLVFYVNWTTFCLRVDYPLDR